jgi:CRP-like cAMP-binding protein/tRNA A-37 threonylcarbamoyl transferase component Bud32
MGAGASVSKDDIKAQIGFKDGAAWVAAEDITDLAAAKAEVAKLRKLAADYITENSRADAGKGGDKGKARGAVMDKVEAIDPKDYVKKMVEKPSEVKDMLNKIINSSVLFKHCKREEKLEIVDAFDVQNVTAGTDVIVQGDNGDNFYMIETGSCEVYLNDIGKVGTPITKGGSFGELALMYNTPRAATIKAATDCKLWFIDRTLFRTIVTVMQALRTTKYVGYLEGVSFTSTTGKTKTMGEMLSKPQLEQIAGALEVEMFQASEFIIREGQEGDYFYVIEEGDTDVIVKGNKVASLGPGKSFGEKALLSEDKRGASIQATSAVKCLTLGRDDFVMMLGNMDDLIEGKVEEEANFDHGGDAAERVDFSLADLNVIRTLGCGAFGRVKLVQANANAKTYALKCQSKKAICDNCLQDHILNERKILLQLNHPFILSFHGAFKDDKFIYFVLELLQGGELFTHLRTKGQLEEQEAKFYGAQVLLAFGHIHSKQIAYRDLKPENLVLDSDGYIKIVDFGLAKVVDGKTWTLCGTPDYLAPEIILNEGHDKAVDYWALGVLIYEMVAGMPPFYADDPMEVYEKILSATMMIPQHFSKNLSDLVRKLLKIYQSKRLGNGKGGTTAIQKHKWFNSFDFDGLVKKELTSPIKPTISDPLDTSNFDDYGDEEEPDPAACPEWNPEFD